MKKQYSLTQASKLFKVSRQRMHQIIKAYIPKYSMIGSFIVLSHDDLVFLDGKRGNKIFKNKS